LNIIRNMRVSRPFVTGCSLDRILVGRTWYQ
jgi:hypothetical protein